MGKQTKVISVPLKVGKNTKMEINIPKDVPKDKFAKQIFEKIMNFLQDESSLELKMSEYTKENERKKIHEVAENFNLSHQSEGSDNKRFVIISKSPSSTENIKFLGGYFGIFGKRIEEIGKTKIDIVPKIYIENREKRDGNINHTTILLKNEMKEAFSNSEKCEEYSNIITNLKKQYNTDSTIMLHLMAEVLEDDFIDLGLGKVSKNGNEVYFKVLEWKSASIFRKKLGLSSKDYHITVGFKESDIHNVSKGIDTLVNE
eukprot:gene9573-1776_t